MIKVDCVDTSIAKGHPQFEIIRQNQWAALPQHRDRSVCDSQPLIVLIQHSATALDVEFLDYFGSVPEHVPKPLAVHFRKASPGYSTQLIC